MSWDTLDSTRPGVRRGVRHSLRFIALLGLALAASACADAAGQAEEEGLTDARAPLPVADMGPGVEADSFVMVAIPPGDRELQPIGEVSRLVFYGATADFGLKYLAPNGQPIPGARVTLTQLDNQGADRTGQGVEGTILQSSQKVTDGSGVATFRLQAGMRDTTFTLVANATDANPVTFSVIIGREGAGGLTIRAAYDEETQRYEYADITEVAVELYGCPADEGGCTVPLPCEDQRALAAEQSLFGPWLGLAPISPFNGGNDSTAVGDLPDGVTFNVVVLAKGGEGGNIAFGCAETTIIGGTSPQLDIVMTDLPFKFKKDPYRIISTFDFTDLLANSDNESLQTVDQVLSILQALGQPDGRGRAIVDLICGDLLDANPTVCDLISGIADSLVERAIDRFAPQLEPIFEVLGIISDIITIAERMTVIGEFEITNPEGPEFIGNDHRWSAFRFTWQGESRDVTLGPADAGGRNRTIAGRFDAEIDGTQVRILSHSLEFRYGLILLGIAEEWLIPAALGEQGRVSLEEAFASMLDGVCESIDDFIFGNPQDGFCEDVLVGALTELLTDQIGSLVFDGDAFTLMGVADLYDTDGDLRVDELRAGVWTGVISNLPMRGCFEACHGAGCMPNVCQPGAE